MRWPILRIDPQLNVDDSVFGANPSVDIAQGAAVGPYQEDANHTRQGAKTHA